MAFQSTITTKPNRRNVLSMSAALAVASLVPVSAAKSSGADVQCLNSEFAVKCQRYRELKAALDSLYEANNIKLKRLERPELPAALLEPLDIPGFGKRPPDETKHGRTLEGWSMSELERLATQGKWEVFFKEDKKNGSITVKSRFRAVSRATKKRATELLTVRVAYDAAVKKWWSKVNRIENSTRHPMKKMDNALIEALKHPATNAGELFEKSNLAKDADLFPDHSYPGDREDVFVKCLVRDIKALAQQV